MSDFQGIELTGPLADFGTLELQIDEFTRRVAEFAESIPIATMVQVIDLLATRILSVLVFTTPVDTGRLRNGWQLDIDKIPSGQIQMDPGSESADKGRKPSVEGSSATEQDHSVVARELSKLKELKPFSVVNIANNVEYGIYVEEGTDRMAAHRMVGQALENALAALPD